MLQPRNARSSKLLTTQAHDTYDIAVWGDVVHVGSGKGLRASLCANSFASPGSKGCQKRSLPRQIPTQPCVDFKGGILSRFLLSPAKAGFAFMRQPGWLAFRIHECTAEACWRDGEKVLLGDRTGEEEAR